MKRRSFIIGTIAASGAAVAAPIRSATSFVRRVPFAGHVRIKLYDNNGALIGSSDVVMDRVDTGQYMTRDMTLTADRKMTIGRMTVSPWFADDIESSSPVESFPITLQPGDTITVIGFPVVIT